MVNNPLRTLARSYEYQMLYTRMKEGLSVKFFENDSDFTAIQINFLTYLELYHQLQQSIYLKEPNISKEHLESDIRIDAYLYWKSVQDKNESKKEIINNFNVTPKQANETVIIPTMQYRPRKKK